MHRIHEERGAVAVLFALTIVVLFAAVAFTIDISRLYHERQVLQNAVDFGALAGSQNLPVQGSSAGDDHHADRARCRSRERTADRDGGSDDQLPMHRRRLRWGTRRDPDPVRLRSDVRHLVVGMDAEANPSDPLLRSVRGRQVQHDQALDQQLDPVLLRTGHRDQHGIHRGGERGVV